jgi:hypothetical protein
MGNVVARERAAQAGDVDSLNRMNKRRPAEAEHWLTTDDELAAAYEDLKVETRMARLGRDEAARGDAEARLDEARAELEASGAVRWLLRSKGNTVYETLLKLPEHRPTEEDHARVRQALGNPNAVATWNSETFPYAVIELAVVEPAGVTADDLRRWLAGGQITDQEIDLLCGSAVRVHTAARVLELGKSSRRTRRSAAS